MNVTVEELHRQIAGAKANGLFDLIADAAQASGIGSAFALAVASRETNMTNELGDGGHGVGIMQIDTQHAIAAQAETDGSWRTNPAPLISYGVAMLADNMRWATAAYPQFEGVQKRGWQKIAASAYNAGQGNAAAGVAQGDSDLYTTGQDYGRDVVERTQTIATLLNAASTPQPAKGARS